MDATPPGAEIEGRLSELKEIKLKLPLRHHVSLHSLKLLRSESISDLVAGALEAYFSRQGLPPAGAAPQAPSESSEVDVA